MDWLKKVWEWIVGGVKSLLASVLDEVIEQAKDIVADKELAALALDAVRAAAHEGLSGDKAWGAARDSLTKALREAGRDLTACAIDTALQNVYSAWKRLGKPEA